MSKFSNRVELPLGLQVSCPELFAAPHAVRFMGNLTRLLGSYGAIGPRMARELLGWKWPTLLEQSDPTWRWLYIARQAATGIVKIGISGNPIARMSALPSGCGQKGPFSLIAVVPRCNERHESALCSLFSDARFLGVEWFADTLATRIFCWNAALQRNDAREALGRHLYPNMRAA